MDIQEQSMNSTSSTSFTVWIVTSPPFDGATRTATQDVKLPNQNDASMRQAVMGTYSTVGDLPFTPVNFGIRKGNDVVGHGQIENGKITQFFS